MIDLPHMPLLDSVLVQDFWLNNMLLSRSLALELHASLPFEIRRELIAFLLDLQLLHVIESLILELQTWQSIFKHRVWIWKAVANLDIEVARWRRWQLR